MVDKTDSGILRNPTRDVAEELTYLMGDTGGLNEAMGGYRIKVYLTNDLELPVYANTFGGRP